MEMNIDRHAVDRLRMVDFAMAQVVAGWCIILKGTFMGMEGNGVLPPLDIYSR